MPSNRVFVLIVEDDEPKLHAIEQFIKEEFPNFGMEIAKSLTSAIDRIMSVEIQFAIVDMSIPTYDFAVDRTGGGRPQGFGGEDILKFIDSEFPTIKSVVLTQYTSFGEADKAREKTIVDLERSLTAELSSSFLGVIYYESQHGEWRQKIGSFLHMIAKDA
jgi:ActR/RegA family two-component response regulator